MRQRIEDYGLIGDGHTAALVGRNGSIDWLCLPHFDSGACLAALIGTRENGFWRIAPVAKVRKITRRYIEGTMILVTTFRTKDGEVELIDFMAMDQRDRHIIRRVRGTKGKVKIQFELAARFDYGMTVPWLNEIDDHTHTMVAGPDSLVLRTSLALRAENGVLTSQFTVKDGETVSAVLGYSPSYQESPAVIDADRSFQRTKAFWQGWSMRGAEAGPWTTVVRRSLLTLKALTFHPTGGIVAAPTTSLPEFLGGERNWDYRYCWLRDATFTLLAFLNGGYEEEADLWREWLLKAVAGRPEQIQIMYGLRGERRLDEWTVPWLSGYRKSSPVRVGNMAAKQTQLDIYGELSHAMAVAAMGGLPPPARGLTLRTALLVHLEKVWKEPDAGIWEIRGDPRHFVHSKVMAWVSFDRAATSNYLDGDGPKQKHYRRVADRIHADICKNGVDPTRQCFVQSYGSTELDASALLFAIVGFLPPNDDRVVNTVREIEERLVHDGFVMRYETDSGIDGLPPGEGAFLACSFWLVDIYVLQGRYEDAQRLFERLISLTNEVGLLAEEYDPRAKRQLGNFPQAFSHVALVNSAFALHRATSNAKSGRHDGMPRSPPHIKPNRA
ncbi:glycoside hydrolase family 15 protein [Pseudomonas aeruginosa]|uniref:glycoside hydrolase family 15 protein n=1 Tax=Pseudomonas aeruginosa TaxID=287 RepID=UPI0013735D4D|nr:glycoside hydrolase family 15 protein [Pseudomonas aeruginosa]NBK54262.1 glycoside hydrolase family 15 protein [Pseudomonas aeruginosa]